MLRALLSGSFSPHASFLLFAGRFISCPSVSLVCTAMTSSGYKWNSFLICAIQSAGFRCRGDMPGPMVQLRFPSMFLLIIINRNLDRLYLFSLKSVTMKFRDYIERRHVFTAAQLAADSGLSESSIQTMLRRAIDAGQVERVRRGVYVSKVGRHADAGVDAFELVSALDSSAVLSFHTALEAHGVAHNVSAVCQFRSCTVKSPFGHADIAYRPYPCKGDLPAQAIRRRDNLRVLVTTREQTIIDCLEHPDRCGGIEEALRSLSLFPYVDAEILEGLASARSASLAARTGWLLEQKADSWRVPPAVLGAFEGMAKGGPFRLDKDSTESLGWSRRWRLCLPASEGELRSWLQ